MTLGIASAVVWSLWLYLAVSSRFAKAIVTDFQTTTSIVMLSYREHAQILAGAYAPGSRTDPRRSSSLSTWVTANVSTCSVRSPMRLRPIVYQRQGNVPRSASASARHVANPHPGRCFPDTFRAFTKQRVRWSRNSMRTYVTAIWKGLLLRAPNVTKIMVL